MSANFQNNRPLSPHLGIYRWSITMALSISHRATGMALAAGTLLLVWFLCALAGGAAAYECFDKFIHSPLGIFMLVGWSFAAVFHMLTGIRHLLMDMGFLFHIPHADKFGTLIVIMAVLLTAALWFVC